MVSDYFSGGFWKATGERAVRSAAGAILTVVTGNTFDLWELDWKQLGGMALGAALVSVLMAVSTAKITGENTPGVFEVTSNKARDLYGAGQAVGRLQGALAEQQEQSFRNTTSIADQTIIETGIDPDVDRT